VTSLFLLGAVAACRGSAWRLGCTSLFSGFACVASRVSPRRASSFLLGRQKKRTKEKATRVRVSLRCAKGNLRCSQQAGSLQTRLSPQTCNLLYPPVAALLGTRTREWAAEDRYQYTCAGESGSRSLPLRWCKAPAAAPVPAPTPLCVRRAAQRSADQAVRMSEPAGRVCGQPALREQRRLPRSTAQGSQTPGSPFLWFVSFGDPKEMNSPAGARPGLLRTKQLRAKKCRPAARPRPGLPRQQEHQAKKCSPAAGPTPGLPCSLTHS
jgi:hypothetical protein